MTIRERDTMKELSAGGVVYRKLEGELEVQLIQDRFGKITLPKGKMEPGETIEQTALREIEEETGIIEPLDRISYPFLLPNQGTIVKEVQYYLVEAIGGELAAQVEEIRGVEWFEPLEAWKKQQQYGYDNNLHVLRLALSKLGVKVER
jgi:8-oxo-dGTP pyrophosphatase MutT (NUDIX family)